jgi:hypothetical protein
MHPRRVAIRAEDIKQKLRALGLKNSMKAASPLALPSTSSNPAIMASPQIQNLIEARNLRYGRGFTQLDVDQVSACLTDGGLVWNDVGTSLPACNPFPLLTHPSHERV